MYTHFTGIEISLVPLFPARFSTAHQLLVDHKLSKDMITEMVSSANVALRYACSSAVRPILVCQTCAIL